MRDRRGRRRHDAWTTGDVHDIAYRPRVVLVVENRDPRLWFPPVSDTIVVEGGGKAAAALLANVSWIRAADHVVYWGDIDADGYMILDHFRATLAEPAPDGAPAKPVTSILMEATDLHHYSQHGVNHDKAGRPIKPSPEHLPHLTEAETTAYRVLADLAHPEDAASLAQRCPIDSSRGAGRDRRSSLCRLDSPRRASKSQILAPREADISGRQRLALDGFRPDRYCLIGAVICLAGVAVIMDAPRGHP